MKERGKCVAHYEERMIMKIKNIFHIYIYIGMRLSYFKD